MDTSDSCDDPNRYNYKVYLFRIEVKTRHVHRNPCMGFSHGYGKVPEESYAVEAIRKAHDFGCTFFDTAEGYGKEQFYAGHNEELLGKALAPFRKEVVLATKFHIGEIASLKNVELYDAVRQGANYKERI